MRALIVVALVACGPSYRTLSLHIRDAGKNTVCLVPGARHEVRVHAEGYGRKVDPRRIELESTIGTFEGTTLVLPEQPLKFLPRLWIHARDRHNGAFGKQRIRTWLHCAASVDLSASAAPVRIEVGHLSTKRRGPFALVRITQANRVWWRLAPVGRHILVRVTGAVEVLVEDSVVQPIVQLADRESPATTLTPGLGATLVAAAGGMPDEGAYDPKEDYNPGYVDPDEIQSDRGSW